MIANRDLPPCADPEAIEARFAKQIEFLKDLAVSFPFEQHLPVSRRPDEKQIEEFRAELEKYQGTMEEWQRRVDQGADLFADPAIIGASVINDHSSQYVTRTVIKECEELEESWFGAMLESISGGASSPGVDKPAVRRLHVVGRRLVRIENLFLDPAGKRRGYQLVIDLDRLEEK